MSKKYHKHKEVEFGYLHVPLKYTFIKHPTKPHKELVLIDDLHLHYVAAYRNNKKGRIGRTFLLKKTANGFIFKDKEYKHGKSGWVF